MAKLRNQEGTSSINISLSKGDTFPDWVDYKIVVSLSQRDGNKFEVELNDNCSFDNELDVEVENIYKGLRLVSKGEVEQFFFTPYDEKDFELKVERKENDFFDVTISSASFGFLNKPPINGDASLTISFVTDKSLLILFCDSLKKEYLDF